MITWLSRIAIFLLITELFPVHSIGRCGCRTEDEKGEGGAAAARGGSPQRRQVGWGQRQQQQPTGLSIGNTMTPQRTGAAAVRLGENRRRRAAAQPVAVATLGSHPSPWPPALPRVRVSSTRGLPCSTLPTWLTKDQLLNLTFRFERYVRQQLEAFLTGVSESDAERNFSASSESSDSSYVSHAGRPRPVMFPRRGRQRPGLPLGGSRTFRNCDLYIIVTVCCRLVFCVPTM